MAGTKAGAQIAKMKNLAKNPNFYADLGRIGGRASNTGGFAYDKELAKVAGTKGGMRSKRGHKFVKETELYIHYINQKTGDDVRFKKQSEI